MNSTIETPIQLEGKLDLEVSLEGRLSVPEVQYKEIDNEYGGQTAIIS